MEKITIKLIKYFMSILTVVVLICFIATSIFVSKYYMNQQYNSLKNSAQDISSAFSEGIVTFNIPVNVVLIKNGIAYPLGHSPSIRTIATLLNTIGSTTLNEKGSFHNQMGGEYLYYKLHTDYGDIVVFQNNKFSTAYLRIVYIILGIVYVLALILSIPVISYIGKKFTSPILKLEKASIDIANGNFNIDPDIKTGDEIENLSESIKHMASSLEEKHALQRDFIANVSHDFKTPLSVIRGYSEAIHDGILDDDGKIEYSREIIKEVDRLNSLVMDIMELSKLQGSGNIFHKDFFNLKEFLEDCSEKFHAIAEQKSIDIVVNCANLTVYGDSKYLYRVVYNFIDNALKFSSLESKIDIFAVKVSDGIRVSVKDYGSGIDENMMDDIWNRYYKHSKSGGMGLGLAICSEILKAHGFTYGVTSTAGEGSEFYFIITNEEKQNH